MFFVCQYIHFSPALLYFLIKYNSLILVILLKATNICPWLKDFWDSNVKPSLTPTPSAKVRPCILWTVHAQGSVKGNCVLLTDGCFLFLREPNNSSCFFIGTRWCCQAVTSNCLATNPALSSLNFTHKTLTALFKDLNFLTLPTKTFTYL